MRLNNPGDAFSRLAAAVHRLAGEESAVSEVLRTLIALDMARSAVTHPEVYETRYQGAVLRIYVWRDTPYGSEVVLATGPQFENKVALGSAIKPTNEVGLFIHGVLRDTTPSSLYKAESVASRAERRAKGLTGKRPRRSTVVEETPSASASASGAAKAAEQAVQALEKAEKPKRGRKPKSTAKVEAHATAAVEAAQAAAEAEAIAKQAEAEAREAARKAQAEADALAAEARAAKDREAQEEVSRAKRAAAAFLSFLDEAE